MMDENNHSIAERWFIDLWSTGDLAVADQIVDPGYAPEWIHIEKTGPDQVKHEVRYFRSVFPDLRYEIVDTAGQGDKVWVRYRGTGTHEGNAWGFEPSGGQATFEGVTIFTLGPVGKITDRWGAFCFYDIFADLGLVPPFWELGQALGGVK